MKGWWWKLGSVALLLYVVIIGLRTPLKPALVHVSIDRIAPGEVSFEVTGYNTHFDQGPLRAELENDGQTVCAQRVEVLDAAHVRVAVNIPPGLRTPLTTLRILSRTDGPLVLHEAFYTEGLGTGITVETCGEFFDAENSMAGHSSKEGLRFPHRSILNETVRNLFFHVPMWFAMMVLMSVSFVRSLMVLRNGRLSDDRTALSAVNVSLLFATLGLITGSLWARVTWGAWWTSDAKLNGAAVTVLIYAAYLVLRGSVPDPHKRARLAAVYNIFAYALMLVFIMVLPRLTDSLHPGNGGNPAFSQYDLDDSLRTVFYPAVLGWIGLSLWVLNLTDRTAKLEASRHEAHG